MLALCESVVWGSSHHEEDLLGIVDLYHFGTRNWFANHMWWAAHNGHTIETNVANDEEVQAYVEKQKALLAERFQSEKTHAA